MAATKKERSWASLRWKTLREPTCPRSFPDFGSQESLLWTKRMAATRDPGNKKLEVYGIIIIIIYCDKDTKVGPRYGEPILQHCV